VIAKEGDAACVTAGFIMIIIPQLLVMGVAAADEVVVTVEYSAFKENTSDCEEALVKTDVPGVLVADAATVEIRGFWLVTKSLQSCELEVVIVSVFLGVVVATRGKVPYPLTISVF
jgi:hypothetical protein